MRSLLDRVLARSGAWHGVKWAHFVGAVVVSLAAACSGGDAVEEPMDASVRRDARPTDANRQPESGALVLPNGAPSPGVYGDAGVIVSDADLGCSANCNAPSAGCLQREICDNGQDDDCDGQVDEECACVPGSVQPCLAAPPSSFRGRTPVGGCGLGQQVCVGDGEFGVWGTCEGGLGPEAERCDGLDNNCNGCVDENMCCNPSVHCPAPGDPRIPTLGPFQPVTIRGASIISGADRFEWVVEGGPCDRLLRATSNHVSYTLEGAGTDVTRTQTADLQMLPTLSGDYKVTVVGRMGVDYVGQCTFLVPVRAPGLRVEACWDTTGSDDVDLWLHRTYVANGATATLPDRANTCYFGNCRNGNSLNWDPETTSGHCGNGVTTCSNPRLDVDNIRTPGIPENINVDAPPAGATYRVMLDYYGASGTSREVHPMVNIYCGGALRATFGGATVGTQLYGGTPIRAFNLPGGTSTGSLWRIAEVKALAADACEIHAMAPPGSTQACVDNTGNRTVNGPCVVLTR